MSTQRQNLVSTQTPLLNLVEICDPLCESEAAALDKFDCVLSDYRHFSVSAFFAKAAYLELGVVWEERDCFRCSVYHGAFREVHLKPLPRFFVGMKNIDAEHDKSNESDTKLAPAVSQQSAAISYSYFLHILFTQGERLVPE